MRIDILLTAGPFQFENWETAASIAEAALDKGHEVAFFLSLDGVYNLVLRHSSPGSIGLPHQKFVTLLGRGARALVCGTAAEMRGLECRNYPEGVAVGGLPDFAVQLGDVDRLISL